MPEKSYRPRRAVLFVPASNEKAIAKLPSLACDTVIFDLEDAVAPEAKTVGARTAEGLVRRASEGRTGMRHPGQSTGQRMGLG